MFISTDDGQFGMILTRAGSDGMFRFQLIVGGRLIGDADPCVPASGLRQLEQLKPLEDVRVGGLLDSPAGMAAFLRSDVLVLAESLDRWLIRGFVYESDVHILAQECPNGAVVLASTVDIGEYELIMAAGLAAGQSEYG